MHSDAVGIEKLCPVARVVVVHPVRPHSQAQ
jgi:hypothetical protein